MSSKAPRWLSNTFGQTAGYDTTPIAAASEDVPLEDFWNAHADCGVEYRRDEIFGDEGGGPCVAVECPICRDTLWAPYGSVFFDLIFSVADEDVSTAEDA